MTSSPDIPVTSATAATDEATPVAGPAPTAAAAPSKISARVINDKIRYTSWNVFSRLDDLDIDPADAAAELEALIADLEAKDVVVRGIYDVSGLRADADLMVWWHADTAEELQDAVRRFRRTSVGRSMGNTWAGMALHRPAEFNKSHVPAFLAGSAPLDWVCVYPFVRSYEWYLLPDAERREMLMEHGIMGREFNQVLSSTVAAFALGDYEWMLALESTELHDIVDLMRSLRASTARLHVREEIPFFTGRRVDAAQAVEVIR
ncbi:chlorite dismutase [Nakamurella antarctica]|uniref:Coproheme decarboxylase n=1 Tax=Nakamurella antarctica TaxID=1902245 RepID=A0A3G8ZMQ5_9ACTN|nr:hydrogen peroxide-dependent heme synthase [Nakamurella antarctica]AZI58428.1 chlorite dismutase [Nakamurella antarctica]